LQVIGRGAFGVVSRARWRNIDVAVKRIETETAGLIGFGLTQQTKNDGVTSLRLQMCTLSSNLHDPPFISETIHVCIPEELIWGRGMLWPGEL